MVQLFLKYNTLKFSIVLIFLLAIRGFAYSIGIPQTESEITWLLVGERMSDGFTLYKTIWTDIEPFSAFIYYILDVVFGKSSTALFVVSLLLVFFQSVIFTLGLNQNKVFKEATIFPAILYVLFTSLFFDFYSLSPLLLGITFLLFAFNMICVQSRTMTGEDRFFYIGVLIGIASLFYLPLAFFLLFALFSLGLYSSTSFKKLAIMVVAFLFPYIVLLIYYFWIDNLTNFYTYVFHPLISSLPILLADFPTLLKISAVPAIFVTLSIVSVIANGRFIHYQYKIIKIVGLWFLTGVLAISFEKTIEPHLLLLFVVPLSFFLSHFFVLMGRKKLIVEVLFYTLVGGVLLISFYNLKKPDSYTKENLIVAKDSIFTTKGIVGKGIMVFGAEKKYYINNSISSSYINWSLSNKAFTDLTKYENISTIYQEIELNKPQIIVDQEDKMNQLSQIIPILKKEYMRIDSTNIYRRASN